MNKWRIVAEDSDNARTAPWSDAVGIEELDPNLITPSVICWFTRGWDRVAQDIVNIHNSTLEDPR